MKRFSLTEDTLNKVLQYLATKPFVEVTGFITTIQREAQEVVPPVQTTEAPTTPYAVPVETSATN